MPEPLDGRDAARRFRGDAAAVPRLSATPREPRSWLHALLALIDDDLVEIAVLRERDATPGVLRPLFLADWLRMTSFEPGLGPVLWSGAAEEAMARLERDWDRRDVGRVKMTPTGANALRAMDDPPSALLAFYEGHTMPPPQRLAAAVADEVEAVTALALVPAGLSRAGRGRTD